MRSAPFHPKRKITQGVTLLIILLIPTLGIFRIDFASASFFILGRSVHWSNFPFIIGLSLAVATAPLLTYLWLGAAWCGWACPQNFVSEWANQLTFRWLGKRADVRVDGKGMVVAEAKNTLYHWVQLGVRLLSASFLLALPGLMFFYAPLDVWHFVTKANRPINMTIMYLFASFLIFINLAVIRYFLCDYACLYRVGHRLFKTSEALHVVYDDSRSTDCQKCNYCATSCITGIDPTAIGQADACINCGECIDACQRLHDKSDTSGLLLFQTAASRKASGADPARPRFYSIKRLLLLVFLSGSGLMAWGLVSEKPVDQLKLMQAQQKLLDITRVCTPRCASLQASCDGQHIANCYQASECQCACSLEQDPSNPLRSLWETCVTNSRSKRQALLSVQP